MTSQPAAPHAAGAVARANGRRLRLAAIVALATRVRFQELVAAGRWTEAAQILRRVPQDFDFIDRLFVADVRGTLMADVPQSAQVRGRNFAHRDWFKGVSRDAIDPRVQRLAPGAPGAQVVRDAQSGRERVLAFAPATRSAA